MKKGRYNFVVDTILALLFMTMVSTGILMYLFPKGLGRTTALGLTRHEWGDIHLTVSILFLVFILVHLVLHYNWEKAEVGHFLGIGGKTLAISVLVIFIAILSVPFIITRGLPDTRGYGYRSGKYFIPEDEDKTGGLDEYLSDTLYDDPDNSVRKNRRRGGSR
jgi:hypothetical protein